MDVLHMSDEEARTNVLSQMRLENHFGLECEGVAAPALLSMPDADA